MLEDTRELELAGIATFQDRSDELDRWFGEQGDDDDYWKYMV
jgi:hypothetical protein